MHTHLVVANRVQGPDGRWTALDGRDLYRHRLAADAIYRATYQRQLSSTLGVGWTAADRHGNREFQGVPDRIVAALDRAPVAIGTRAGDASGPVARRAASRVFNLAIRGALGLPFGDTQSGLKGSSGRRLRRSSAKPESTASPSMSRCCGWPASSAWK